MDEQIIADVEQWLDEVVIGLDLCPFAARPRREKRVRIAVSHATDDEALLNDLQAELERQAARGWELVQVVAPAPLAPLLVVFRKRA